MKRNIAILLIAAIVIALPFLMRRPAERSTWKPGDPELIIISPHNEAVRFEFGLAFSRWHEAHYGKPVRVDWRAIGGSSEISRYLTASFTSAARAWWLGMGREWPIGAGNALINPSFNTQNPPYLTRAENESDADFAQRNAQETARWETLRDLYLAFRATDDPKQFSARIDLLMGGGDFDHKMARGQGLTVSPWPNGQRPAGLFIDDAGRVMLPDKMAGETWQADTYFGNTISTFGICYNRDRLRDLGIDTLPDQWEDLADPRFAHNLGLADPTKSGSIAKSFEMIVHQQCYNTLREAGFSDDEIDRYEAAIAAAALPAGDVPPTVPAAYQAAIEEGWIKGIRLLQRIGANARYFTDSASKVPIDVSMGAAAAGVAIDYYARFQAQTTLDENGRERMDYITPIGGSGVSCDPVGLLRGAPNREIAVRFIEFTLRDEGQKLWAYKPGTPGGPVKFALRRIPIRRSFFPSDDPAIQQQHEEHNRYAADNLADPRINPYAIAEHFTYHPRWTASHFSTHSALIRAMCLNAAQELQEAWTAILRAGGPDRQPEAMAILQALPEKPEPVTWRSAPKILRTQNRLDTMRDWTLFYRARYAQVIALLKDNEGAR